MSDYDTIQRRRNLVVGVFVIMAMCALGWLVFKFGELPTIVTRWGAFQVNVQFPTAPGVQRETPVRFCGYQIGSVTKVSAPQRRKHLITGEVYHQTLVVLGIDQKYINIPSNVEIKIMSRGLGSSYIELIEDPSISLKPLDPNKPETEYLVHGMLLQGSTGAVSEFFPAETQKNLDELVAGLKVFLRNANEIIGDKQIKENLKTTLANLSKASAKAIRAMEEFERLSAAGTKTLKNVDVRTENLAAAMVEASGELSKTLAQVRLIVEKVNEGEGTAGRIVNDGRLYENMLEVTARIQMLVDEISQFVVKSREKGVPIKLK